MNSEGMGGGGGTGGPKRGGRGGGGGGGWVGERNTVYTIGLEDR